jgi:acyl-CoA thioesterase
MDVYDMDEFREFFKRDLFAAKNDIETVEIGPGSAEARMKVTREHLNAVGTAHGGALFSLADFAFAMAANSGGQVTVAINVSISYFKAVSSGVLTARAWEVSGGGRIASYTVEIRDEDGDLVALFQGMAYRKREMLKDLI